MSAIPHHDPSRLQELHGRMVQALLDGGGLHAVAGLAARAAGGRVVVDLSRDGLAATGGSGEGAPVRVPIVTGGDFVGTVTLFGDPRGEAADALHAAAMATLTYLALMRDDEPRDETGARLVEAVLDDAADAVTGAAAFAGGGALVALVGAVPIGRVTAAIADHVPEAARTVRDDRVWALLPADADGAGLATTLHERLGVAAAATNAGQEASSLRFALDVAALAAALVADGAVSPAAAARGTWRLLLRDAVRAPEDVRALAATLGPLLDDRTPQAAQQRRTLETYLANDCNMNATAAAMPAHRHTVAYRLERIRELTGLDPLRAEGREQLGIALKARAVAQMVHASSQ
jgi:PucR C-terminal helix-turn-helix domain